MTMLPGVYVVEHKTSSEDIGEGSPYWKRLEMDAQISKYLVGGRALGHEPLGVLYDVIAKPKMRPLEATPMEKRQYTQPRDKACPECKKKNPSGPAPHMIEVSRLDKETLGDELGEPVLVACADGRVVTDPGGKLYANLRDRDETAEEYHDRILADIKANPDKYYRRGVVVRLEQEERDAAKDTWELAQQMHAAKREERWPRNPDACDQYGSFCHYFGVCTGELSIDDPILFRQSDREHEELSKPEEVLVAESKRRLPILSSSSMKAYRSCPRKYFYGYVRRRRSIKESDVLRFGTLMHKALEVWWRSIDLAAALAEIASGEADAFERAKAEALMRGYHARWSDEPFNVLAVEEEFVAPLVNPTTGRESQTWQRGGKIDALVRVGVAAAQVAA